MTVTFTPPPDFYLSPGNHSNKTRKIYKLNAPTFKVPLRGLFKRQHAFSFGPWGELGPITQFVREPFVDVFPWFRDRGWVLTVCGWVRIADGSYFLCVGSVD